MDNTYKYDAMDNITSLVNAGKPQTLQGGKTIGGSITHTYSYDEWDRLIGAKGTFNGGGSKSATYDLRMEYDNLYNVTKKQLNLTQNDLQFQGSLTTGYELTYNYKEDDPFRLQNIDSKEFSSESDTLRRVTNYDFDANGNLTLQLVDTERDSSHCADTMGTRVKNHLWDEENRLLAINDNGFVSNYFYDANGERTVKLSKPDLFVYVNSSEKLKGDSLPVKFVGYVSPYLVVTNGGRYTKHIYAGTQRIASKLGDINAFGADPRRVATAGHDVDNIEPIDFSTKYKNQNDAFKARFDSLGSKFNGKSLDDYVNGQSFCCNGNSLDEIEKNNTQSAENAKIEDNLYFYHPDHLGSTNLITNFDGEVTQSVAYIPYGEVFVEERNGSWASPFLFNAKELDEETGLYYYGARYLNPTDCRWLSTDPMFEKYVGMSPYNYCAGNPVKLVDPTGMNWYKNKATGDMQFMEGETIETYEDSDNNLWLNMGQTYTDKENKKYYSLFGQVYSSESKKGMMTKAMDHALIEHINNYVDWYKTKGKNGYESDLSSSFPPISFKPDFFDENKSVFLEENHHRFEYAGANGMFYNYEGYGKMIGEFDYKMESFGMPVMYRNSFTDYFGNGFAAGFYISATQYNNGTPIAYLRFDNLNKANMFINRVYQIFPEYAECGKTKFIQR